MSFKSLNKEFDPLFKDFKDKSVVEWLDLARKSLYCAYGVACGKHGGAELAANEIRKVQMDVDRIFQRGRKNESGG